MTKRLDADDPCPARDGFAMPAEWATHARTWMCWPCRIEAWGGPEGLLRAKQAVARVARAISSFEPVVIAARPLDAAEAKLATSGKVEIFEVALDDSWARDFGPTFLRGPDGARPRCSGSSTPGATNIIRGRRMRSSPRARRGTRTCGSIRAPLVCEGGAIHTRRPGHADHDRAVPAQRQPQSASRPPAGRGAAGALHRRAARDLAGRRLFRRRDRRPCRQHRLLRRRRGGCWSACRRRAAIPISSR